MILNICFSCFLKFEAKMLLDISKQNLLSLFWFYFRKILTVCICISIDTVYTYCVKPFCKTCMNCFEPLLVWMQCIIGIYWILFVMKYCSILTPMICTFKTFVTVKCIKLSLSMHCASVFCPDMLRERGSVGRMWLK